MLSLRLLSAVDWNAFFERSSQVQQILREDPAGVYPHQDFATSDRYRKVVERIARGSNADELGRGAEGHRAGTAQGMSREPAKGHVGYYLIGHGEAELRAAFGYQPGAGERLLDWVLAHPKDGLFRVDLRCCSASCSRWSRAGASGQSGSARLVLVPL